MILSKQGVRMNLYKVVDLEVYILTFQLSENHPRKDAEAGYCKRFLTGESQKLTLKALY